MDLEELVDEAEQAILKGMPVDFDEIIEAAKKGVPAGLAEVVRSNKIDQYEIEPGTPEDIEFNKLIDILTVPDPGLPGGRRRRRKTKRSTRVRKLRRSQRSLSSKQRRSYSGSSTSYLTKRRKQGSK